MCAVYRDEVSSADASHSRGNKQIKLHGYVNSECDWVTRTPCQMLRKCSTLIGIQNLFLNSCEKRQWKLSHGSPAGKHITPKVEN